MEITPKTTKWLSRFLDMTWITMYWEQNDKCINWLSISGSGEYQKSSTGYHLKYERLIDKTYRSFRSVVAYSFESAIFYLNICKLTPVFLQVVKVKIHWRR